MKNNSDGLFQTTNTVNVSIMNMSDGNNVYMGIEDYVKQAMNMN